MPISKELLDELLKDYSSPEDVLGQNGLLKQLTTAVLERALDGGLTHQMSYGQNEIEGRNTSNSRNGVVEEARGHRPGARRP